MPHMRAKMEVMNVETVGDTQENVIMMAVSGTGYGPKGESEDNTYARWTPSGNLNLSITNPALHGTFRVGQKFYLDFTEAPE